MCIAIINQHVTEAILHTTEFLAWELVPESKSYCFSFCIS